ncbi:MAG: deoxynucleoside kinase [Thermodesulfobacteriota bacterium]|nr:deoxynucleoside kinase [Thermodesulfobacteriota bacterium]
MHNHIVIEGPLGVGKTSLALMLAEKMNGEALLEDIEENPFLAKFYKNPDKYGFQTQIFFLLRRYQQALKISQIGLFKRAIISDYLFDKDRIFARTNLDDNEFWLYEQLYKLLKKRVTPPDLIIFLQARTEVLMERIKRRDRKYERPLQFKYLEKINQAFNDFFFHYSDSPLLVVNASQIDFVNIPQDYEDMVEQIKKMRSGTQYYIPISSRSM